MFISKLTISNFRNFTNTEVEFNQGINVIIGHNNCGKTNLLKALSLIFDLGGKKKLFLDDFNRYNDNYFNSNSSKEPLEKNPPMIKITAILKESEDQEDEKDEDKTIIFSWLTKIDKPYEAKLTFEYFLPEGKDTTEKYHNEVKNLITEGTNNKNYFWNKLMPKYIDKYISRIYVGDESFKNRVENDGLSKFDFQFLDAIRDVESELFSGKNPLLKEVLSHFLDHDNDGNGEELKENFFASSTSLIDSVKSRINIDTILEYSKDVGASLGGEPFFDGKINEIDLFSALKLVIRKEHDFNIPITHNGLGYNNLIYISILLSKMQKNLKNQNIDEHKVFPMLIIEEPEAHLHPAMQQKFLKFLRKNLGKKVRQVFVTSHSTHITSSVELDEIICLNKEDNYELHISYPGRVFDPSNKDDVNSKKYLKRFLDATKSDLLFSKSVIFVEGMAEHILMPVLANGLDKNLDDKHISVIRVDGTCFKHFLKLFNYDSSDNFKKYALNKKVTCLIDPDPSKKYLHIKESRFKSCYPFEIDLDLANYEYRKNSTILDNLEKEFTSNNIKIFSSKDNNGKTLEYDLMFNNCDELPLGQHLATSYATNRKELLKLITNFNKDFNTLASLSSLTEEIKKQILESSFNETDKKRSLVSVKYLLSVEENKGENALEISEKMELLKNLDEFIKVPPHIVDLFNFIYG